MFSLNLRTDTSGIKIIKSKVPKAEAWAAERALEKAWAGAQRRVPVRTGELWYSIRGKAAGRAFRLVANKFYSIFVEYGTSKMAARPYMRPAFKEVPWQAIADGSLKIMGVS